MKLKYTGIYAPESTWEEVFYHAGTVLVQNGVVETDDELVIEALQRADFIPYEEWEEQELERQEKARAEAEAQNQKALAEATERIRAKNARSEQRLASGESFVPFTEEELAQQEAQEVEEAETTLVRVGDGVEEVKVHSDRADTNVTERTVKDPEVSQESLPDERPTGDADAKAAGE